MSPEPGKKKPKRTNPESLEYEELKGKSVMITRARDGSVVTATLRWVDVFTIGIVLPTGERRMLYKQHIESLGAAP